jgi:hypothetical protein
MKHLQRHWITWEVCQVKVSQEWQEPTLMLFLQNRIRNRLFPRNKVFTITWNVGFYRTFHNCLLNWQYCVYLLLDMALFFFFFKSIILLLHVKLFLIYVRRNIVLETCFNKSFMLISNVHILQTTSLVFTKGIDISLIIIIQYNNHLFNCFDRLQGCKIV